MTITQTGGLLIFGVFALGVGVWGAVRPADVRRFLWPDPDPEEGSGDAAVGVAGASGPSPALPDEACDRRQQEGIA